MPGKSALGKGGSNKGGADSGTKGSKAPSVRPVGPTVLKFHTSKGR